MDTSGLQRTPEIHSALTTRPDRRVDRYWKGTETICVIAQKDHATQVLDFVATLNLGYLKATLETVAKGHPTARIDELMSWNFGRTQHHIGQSQ